MTFNTKFKSIINNIDNDGDLSQPRDMKVKELMLAQNDFDPTKTIANFENR